MTVSPVSQPLTPHECSSSVGAVVSPLDVNFEAVENFSQVIDLYLASMEYAALRLRTQQDYAKKLTAIRARFGACSLAELDDRRFTRAVFAWRDAARSKPRSADYRLQVLKLVLSWARRRGMIDFNRAAAMGCLYRSRRRHCSWSDEQIEAFKAAAPPHLKLALVLALETGQRQADLLTLDWASIEDGLIHVLQRKTGVEVAIPITSQLRQALAVWACSREGAVLRRSDGAPWVVEANGFRNAWKRICRRAGVEGLTFHDLRGTFVTRRLADGWSALEVALCTGHSFRNLAMLDAYADRRSLSRRTAEQLRARVAGLE